MTYNVFGGTLNLAKSINHRIKDTLLCRIASTSYQYFKVIGKSSKIPLKVKDQGQMSELFEFLIVSISLFA